jgi:hypothetical protein
MHYLILVAVLAATAAVVLLFGACSRTPDAKAQEQVKPPPVTEETKQALTPRAEIEQRLKALAENPGPKPDLQGASCYAPRPMLMRAEYTCPKDGSKTQYTSSGMLAGLVADDLPAARGMITQIQALKPSFTLALDESEFCRTCSPDVKDPAIILVVGYPDAKSGKLVEHRTRGVHGEDLKLLWEFLSGSQKHQMGGPDTRPLKDFLPRLRELLGFEPRPPAPAKP